MKREQLIEARVIKGKSREEVAEDLIISKTYVRMLENGTVKPGRELMIRFSKYYGLGIQVLFPDLF